MHVGIHLGTQYLGEMHHLPFRVGQLQGHIALARDGLHQTDADDGQRTCQIAHEVGDLTTLHAHIGIDLVTGDDGAGIRTHHFHVHAEILQLALDEARGELQRLRADQLDLLCRFIQ